MPRYFTKEGLDSLEKDIAGRVSERKESIGEIATAREFGNDRVKNPQLDVALEAKELASVKIEELRHILHDAVIITIQEQSAIVDIGTTVVIIIDGEKKTFTIGAANESLSEEGLISYECPIGQAIIKKRVGDLAEVMIREKKVVIEIKEIRPPSGGYNAFKAKLYPLAK
ncbi:GreA/GreB family elongation factor [Candidatus Peregrinibacteria bacterium]|nr:GreA/GreB family elongation factor [Candidatus Peregrinibacteria bacterium]